MTFFYQKKDEREFFSDFMFNCTSNYKKKRIFYEKF